MSSTQATLLTFFPFLRRRHEFTDADSMGSFVVHHDLAIWALTSGAIERAFILPERLNIFSQQRPVDSILESLTQIHPEIQGRFQVVTSPQLIAQASSQPGLLALGKSSDFTDLALMRRWIPAPVPICGIVHSCLFPGVLSNYMTSLLMARKGDLLCATSTAAFEATQSLLGQAWEHLAGLGAHIVGDWSERISLVRAPLAIDDSWVEPCDSALARQIFGFPPDQVIVLCFGRVSQQYKADLRPLFLAFRSVVERHPEARLVIAGSFIHAGSDTDLSRAAREYGISRHLDIRQNIAPSLKKILFKAADVFVAMSDNVVESFGLTIIEAMGAGLPVIASNWSGYRELVDEGRTGFLIDTFSAPHVWKNASMLAEFAVTPHAEYYAALNTVIDVEQLAQRLDQLVASPELRKELGQRGASKVRAEFVWSVAIHRFAALWRDALSKCDHAPARQGSRLDLRKVFSTYPSMAHDERAPLFVLPSTLARDGLLSGVSLDPAMSAFLRRCLHAPRLLPHLVDSLTEADLQRLYWLIKQGFLKLGHCVQPVPAKSGGPLGTSTAR